MKLFTATNDNSLSAKVSNAVRQAGAECVTFPLTPADSLIASLGSVGAETQVVVFVASSRLSSEELALLPRLRSACAQATIVVVGPTPTLPVILQAIRHGATDFLDVGNDFEAELRNVFARLKSATSNPTKLGQLFTVLSPAGGAGASVLAVNLAAALAKNGSPCALLDFQIRGGDLAALLKGQPRHNLLSLGNKAGQFDRAIFEQSLIKHECGVHLLASPPLFSDYRQITPHLIQQVTQFAQTSYSHVVIDLEDAEHPEQVRTLAASDRIIVPLRLDFVGLCRTKKYIEHLLQAKVPPDRIVPVASRVGQAREIPVKRFAEGLGLSIEHQIPDDTAAMNAAVNLGVPVVISSPKSKVAGSIAHLAASLINPAIGKAEAAEKRVPFNLKSAATYLRLMPT